MLTYQDFEKARDRGETVSFIQNAITEHRNSAAYVTACDADEYDAQRNVTINETVKTLYNIGARANTMTARKIADTISSNHHIASNFFHRLNTQRCAYSLGNGVSFKDKGIKDRLGEKFDTRLSDAAYKALKHGVSYGFWNVDRLHVFALTEFKPLLDEENGSLRAGIRFWSLDWAKKPVYAILYEEDGYTKYRTKENMTGLALEEIEKKRGYRQKVAHTEADGDVVIGEENYGSLPIVPLYGNSFHQSTLIGMREKIDAHDLISSGWCNDQTDCAQIYWLIGNANGMTDDEVQHFMDRLRLAHVALADTENSSVTPYTQEPPYAGREACLARLENNIYSDFGALNPQTIAAGNITATQIKAAYEAMDEEADAFEYQIIEFVQQILALQGVEATPLFQRSRIMNETEQVQMVMSAAQYLDDRTVLEKLPFVTVDEVDGIMENRYAEERMRKEREGDENMGENA